MVYLEDTIKKVMQLDQNIQEYKTSKEKEIKERKEGLSKKVESMWTDIEEEIKNFKDKIQNEYEKKIKENKEQIEKDKEEQIKNVKNKYEDKKEAIIDEAINSILNPSKGE